ncbi:MAG: AAA family ATPase [Saprospiraceae bacterium]
MEQNKQHSSAEIFSDYFNDNVTKKIAYFLAKKLEYGDLCIDLNDAENIEELKILKNQILKSPFVTDDPSNNIQPFVLHNDSLLYLQRYYYHETIIIEKILNLISNDSVLNQENIDFLHSNSSYIKEVLNNNAEWQKNAVISALINQFQIITGGPGTGKTTTISKFIHIILHLFPEKK